MLFSGQFFDVAIEHNINNAMCVLLSAEMRAISSNSFLTVQSLHLPLKTYKKFTGKRYALLEIDKDYSVIVAISLNNHININNCCFLDRHVIITSPSYLSYDPGFEQSILGSVNDDDIKIISEFHWAKTVEVLLVVSNMTHSEVFKKLNSEPKILKNTLKLFTICKGCLINISGVPALKDNGLQYIIVTDVSGKRGRIYGINENTSIEVKKVMSAEMFIQSQSLKKNDVFDKLFTPLEPKKINTLQKLGQTLINLFNFTKQSWSSKFALKPEKNILLIGPTGSGKTSIVFYAAKKTQFLVISLSCADVSTQGIPIKTIDSLFKKAKLHVANNEQCIILIKNIDLLPKSIITKLVKALDDVSMIDGIIVVSTTSVADDVDIKFRQVGRFIEELEIPMLSEEDRTSLIVNISNMFHLKISDEIASKIAQWTPGHVLSDLILLFRDVKQLMQKAKVPSQDVDLESCMTAATRITPTSMRGTRGLISNKDLTKFSDIGGLEDVKKALRVTIQWRMKHPESFERLGIPPVRGILLHGPPGCAKTTLVKALASESNATFLSVSSADLYSPYVGESEKRIVKLFTQARVGAPAIIFIDEIDALVGSKDGGRSRGVQERILSTLLVEMDGIAVASSKKAYNDGVIVVGATNRPDLIDDALKRPGRFDKILHIPLPNLTERLHILKALTKSMPLSSDVNLEIVAAGTDKYSGADLKNVCTEAALLALTNIGMGVEEIRMDDFKSILKNI